MSRLRWPDSTNSVSEKPGTIHWAHPTADPELGYVYLPLSTPANDYYGGTALEIICLARASYASMRRRVSASGTSRRVHHGVWDYDFPASAILLDIVVDGRAIKAVAVVSK